MACNSAHSAVNRSNCGLDNFTALFTYEEEMMMLIPWTVLIISSIFIYALIFLAVLTEKEFRTASGYLLMLSLGVSDILFLAFATLARFPISYMFHHGMHIEDHLLKALYSAVGGCVSTSVLHVVIIGYNRYVAVKKYDKYKGIFCRKNTFMFISLTWLVGLTMFFASLVIPGFSCSRYDPSHFDFQPPSHLQGDVEKPCNIDIQACIGIFLASLMIFSSVFFYISVLRALRKVRKSARNSPRQLSTRSQAAGSVSKESKASDSHSLPLTIQFLLVTCVFLVSYSTYLVRWAVGEYYYKNKPLMAFSMTGWIVNFSINPFIYIGFNRRLRNAVVSRIRNVLDFTTYRRHRRMRT